MATDVEEIELRLTTEGGKTVSRTLSGVKKDVSEVAEEAKEAGQEGAESFDRLGDSASDSGSQVERTADRISDATSSMNRMGGASNNASELLFSLGDTAQDAQYGLRGMGNNIGFAAEQASVLVSQAGSGKQAVNALSSAIVGPAGVVLAIQGLVALGPQIIDFFEGSEEATQQWKEELEDAAGDMFEIREEVQSFESATLEQAKTVRDELKTERDQIKSSVSLLEELAGRSETARRRRLRNIQRGGTERERQLVRELNLQEATVDEIQEKLTSERERLSVIKQAVNTVVTEIGSLKAAKRLSEAYQKTSADRAENEEEAAQALTEQAKEIQTLKAASLDLATNIGQRLQEAREEFERGQEIQRSINIREQRDQEGPLEGQIGPDRIRAPQLSAEDFQTETVRQINSAIGVLQRRMDSVDSSSFRSQMQSAVSDLESMRKEIKLAKDEAVNLGPALQQGLANAITKVASAVGKGESIAKALLQSLGALAQQVGQLLIAFGVGGESLKAIASGNPALAIAAGASLVALGAAAQSAVGDAVGGATGGQGNQRPEIEGGGEASAQLDVPGFKSGVDNFRGGLAEVHSNEILALPPASSVVNNQNARAIKGAMSVLGQAGGPTGQARTMQGRMDGKLDIDVSEPDYFGIRAEIRRLDAKMEDLS